MPELAFATGLGLPERSAGAQTYGFIARKGGGKSYAASKLAELLYRAGVPLIAIDPVGIWWGLRLNADGGPGLPIPVIGGLHGDLPLELDAAERLAEHLVTTGSSAVLDVSQLRKGQRAQFVAVFLESLFAAVKAQKVRRQRMVVLEEAQDFAPQHSHGGVSARLLGAVDDVVRLGRSPGLGVMLITQRPQSVSKEVLNQVECLMVGQLQGKHERDAIKGWIGTKGGELDAANSATRAALDSLPYLDPGDFYLWSPQWLKVFQKVRPLPKTTFDASATPELDENVPVIPAIQSLDLDALRAVLAPPEPSNDVAPVASGSHPELERQVASMKAEVASLAEDLLRIQADHANAAIAIRDRDRELAELRRLGVELVDAIDRLQHCRDAFAERLRELPPDAGLAFNATEIISRGTARLADGSFVDLATLDHPPSTSARNMPCVPVIEYAAKAEPSQHQVARHIRKVPGKVERTVPGAELGKCARAILGAVLALGESSRHRAGVLTGYNYGGGGFRNSLSELRAVGMLADGDPLRAGPVAPGKIDLPDPMRGRALLECWSSQLGLCARIILTTLCDLQRGHGKLREWSRSAVATRTALLTADRKPYEPSGGGFRNALTELRRPGLIASGANISLHPEIWRDFLS